MAAARTPRCAALNQLLEAAFRVEDYTRREGNITNEAARQMSVAGQYVEGTRAVTAAAAALVAEHMLSGDTRPLLLAIHESGAGPGAGEPLLRARRADGVAVPAADFVEESDISREKAGNIATLTRTLPLLFLAKLNYDARVVRCVMSEPSPGTLMPVYLLLPTAALMMDRLGQKGYIITDREAVENLRLAFSRKYIDAVPVLKLATGTHGFMESVQLYSKLFAETRKCCMVRYQPPFSLFADEKIALRVVRQDAAVQPYLPALLDYLNTWNQQTPDLYFCEEGLLQFVRTGQMFDLPPALYEPPDVETRRELLLRLRRAAASDKQTLRIVESAQLPLTPSMSVNAFRGRGWCSARLCWNRAKCTAANI